MGLDSSVIYGASTWRTHYLTMSTYVPSEAEREAFGITISTAKFWVTILGSALLCTVLSSSSTQGFPLTSSPAATQMFMVLYGLSVFLVTPKDQRKGRVRFIIISWIILLTSGVDTMIDIWQNSRILLTGGPTGVSYLRAIPAQFLRSQVTSITGDALICVAIITGDVLMVCDYPARVNGR
jgi:hypothetical protein